jgi:hypothetical protein
MHAVMPMQHQGRILHGIAPLGCRKVLKCKITLKMDPRAGQRGHHA